MQVAEDAERLVLFAAHLANHLDQGELFFVRAVGEIQSDNIDSRAHQIAKHRLGVRGGSKCGNDLGAALDGGFIQVRIQRTASV